MVKEGHRAVMLYVIQRNDGKIFRPAAHIDPVYADKLKRAYSQGVEILPYLACVSPEKIELASKIEFEL
jgi:sugar fermentation stimulation protein A